MLFNIQRESLLAPLNQICGVVEKKGTLPVLSNVLLKLDGDTLLLTTSDLDVEMRSECVVDAQSEGEVTVPAHKFLDICKALSDGSIITFSYESGKCLITSGDSRFSLSTLSAQEFPLIDDMESYQPVTMGATDLQRMLKQTVFCMAVQDVRYFLNGLLFEVLNNKIRCVSADGHRLALAECDYINDSGLNKQVLVPRKGVLELQKMIRDIDQPITINMGVNHIKIEVEGISMTSKLIDGKFPDYEAVIPLNMENSFVADRETLRNALHRVAILSNEQYKGVKFKITPNKLEIIGHNPDQEQAEDVITIETDIENIETAFNVNYILDATQAITEDEIQFSFKEALSSCLIKHPERLDCRLVVMPLRI
ncbi:DNA polymerase III subunit beta [Marinicella sp. S1101]|uniref:DNA polymerase III subunit beta n=1 Tax=Marinicella marina TaxID=2996016 RepID=UPI002260E8CF|nr:DNA polymerase III subunit beta [Marinicella marina]MCX7553169.1 DNA polymerase III subunit beta [Marinicella marina]MDJ1138901.1 DNA polymerase III subunit beta [Marinicella marina]